MIICSGSQVVIVVKLEREDEEEGSPHVIAPFFPQVRSLSDHLSQGSYIKKYENHFVEGLGTCLV